MITGNEPIIPQLKYRQEWEDRMDGESLGLVNYSEGGLTLKQHMVIEFTKGFISGFGFDDVVTIQTAKEIVSDAMILAAEVIKQLNDEDK